MKIFNSVSDLQAASLTAGQLTQTKRYFAGQDGGGATYLIKTAVDYAGTPDEYGDHSLANGNVAVLQVNGGEVNLAQFGAVADFNITTHTGTDNTSCLKAAISWMGGAQGYLTSAYEYDPVKTLRINEGRYGFALTGVDRILITSDNIRILGSGMFNTYLYHMGTANVAEFFRFNASYACELSNLTLDGGLPFAPDGTETYGVDVVLTLDQCAHFTSRHLNIANYRIRGIQAIHLWESYFEETRIFNGGFFGTGPVPSGGIVFDDRGKEVNDFAGFESNQIRFNKIAFGVVGSYVKMTVPCFNISFDFVVAEGRTWTTTYSSLGESKWRIGGGSEGIVVDHCWHYAHDQIAVTNANVFDFENAKQNCKFLNYRIYQNIPAGSGNFLETPNIFANSSAHAIEVDLSIEDVGDAVTTLFNGTTAGSLITGRLAYKSASSRTVEDFMGADGKYRFNGKVFFIDTSYTTTTPDVYEWKSEALVRSTIDSGTEIYPEFACRAIANYNGSTDTTNMAKGLTITKSSTGQYKGTFDTAMPDANYAVNLSLVISNLGDQAEIASQSATHFDFIVRDNAGTFHDSTLLNIAVFR